MSEEEKSTGQKMVYLYDFFGKADELDTLTFQRTLGAVMKIVILFNFVSSITWPTIYKHNKHEQNCTMLMLMAAQSFLLRKFSSLYLDFYNYSK